MPAQPENFERIFLTGFMGSGKTTIGSLLAKKIEWKFIDTDNLIESNTGMKVSDIFAHKGELFFRKIEKETILDVCHEKKVVISLGGGALMDIENLTAIKNNGVLVWLKIPLQTALERTSYGDNRPLRSPDIATLKKLYSKRWNGYNEAHIIVNAEEEPIKNTDLILQKISGNYEFSF